MPTPLTDADKVLRNDTGKDIVTQLTAIKTAIENGGGGGGGASTVSQLTDVLLSATIPDGDVLVRDNNLTGGKLWKNKTITVELTQAEYDALENPLPDVDYYITDAPSMQGTSADLSYDGTTKSVYTKIEEVASDVSDLADVVDTKADKIITCKMVQTTLTYNSSLNRFTLPSGVVRPVQPQQCLIGRNSSTGSIYALWYVSTDENFQIGATLSGSAPANGNTCYVNYVIPNT